MQSHESRQAGSWLIFDVRLNRIAVKKLLILCAFVAFAAMSWTLLFTTHGNWAYTIYVFFFPLVRVVAKPTSVTGFVLLALMCAYALFFGLLTLFAGKSRTPILIAGSVHLVILLGVLINEHPYWMPSM